MASNAKCLVICNECIEAVTGFSFDFHLFLIVNTKTKTPTYQIGLICLQLIN